MTKKKKFFISYCFSNTNLLLIILLLIGIFTRNDYILKISVFLLSLLFITTGFWSLFMNMRITLIGQTLGSDVVDSKNTKNRFLIGHKTQAILYIVGGTIALLKSLLF